jgi:hypothetical protein
MTSAGSNVITAPVALSSSWPDGSSSSVYSREGVAGGGNDITSFIGAAAPRT